MPPQPSTPAIADVVHTPEPSAIKPVESSNVKVSEVPNVDESIVAPAIADSMDEVTPTKIDLALIDLHTTTRDDWMWMNDEDNDNDEDEFFFENYIEAGTSLQYDVKENSLDITAVIGAFDEYISSKGLDIADSAKTE
ncbi:unnamed protein product [Phytophthora lilii]|uniref:Unnamed protein product n=1 Tax=Phytophthora lilii TaxID=2077276 RepID=A0A9W6WMD3_9STRA|nr:unnamed protein product [Phytophthora lilii]